jgi:hypothetical protein
MTCAQFREALDCWIDGELSADAKAAVDRHRADCARCGRLAAGALSLRAAVRAATASVPVPLTLETRVHAALASPRPPRFVIWRMAAAASVLLALIGLGATWLPWRARTADAMDSVALHLDDSRAVVLTGTLLCRDCELEHHYGIKAPCRTVGHHGAIATDDGRIWNLVEQATAAELIHDERLLGRRIVVQGRVFRGARTIVIERYQFQS